MKALSLVILALALSVPAMANGIGDRVAVRVDEAGDTLSLYNGQGVCKANQLSAILSMGSKMYNGCWAASEAAKVVYVFLVDAETPTWYFSFNEFELTEQGKYEAGIK